MPHVRVLRMQRALCKCLQKPIAITFPEGADQIADYLSAKAKSGDLLLAVSNGSFDGLCDKLLKKLGAEVPVEATRR